MTKDPNAAPTNPAIFFLSDYGNQDEFVGVVHAVLHTAAPGGGSTCLAAAVAIPGSIPNQVLGGGPLKSGTGGDFTFGHPSGEMTFHTEPKTGQGPRQDRLQDPHLPQNRSHHLRRHRLHQGTPRTA